HARAGTARAADAAITATAADQFQGIAAARRSEGENSANRSAAARAAYVSRTSVRAGHTIAGTGCTVTGTDFTTAGTGAITGTNFTIGGTSGGLRKVERIRPDLDRVDATTRRKFSSNIIACAAVRYRASQEQSDAAETSERSPAPARGCDEDAVSAST